MVGAPDLGYEAAAELGVDLERTIVVPHPGEHWLSVVAALVDVASVVLVRPPVAVGGAPGRAAPGAAAAPRTRRWSAGASGPAARRGSGCASRSGPGSAAGTATSPAVGWSWRWAVRSRRGARSGSTARSRRGEPVLTSGPTPERRPWPSEVPVTALLVGGPTTRTPTRAPGADSLRPTPVDAPGDGRLVPRLAGRGGGRRAGLAAPSRSR